MQQYCHKRRLSNPGQPFFSSFSISTEGGYLPLFTDITTHHLIEQRFYDFAIFIITYMYGNMSFFFNADLS